MNSKVEYCKFKTTNNGLRLNWKFHIQKFEWNTLFTENYIFSSMEFSNVRFSHILTSIIASMCFYLDWFAFDLSIQRIVRNNDLRVYENFWILLLQNWTMHYEFVTNANISSHFCRAKYTWRKTQVNLRYDKSRTFNFSFASPNITTGFD